MATNFRECRVVSGECDYCGAASWKECPVKDTPPHIFRHRYCGLTATVELEIDASAPNSPFRTAREVKWWRVRYCPGHADKILEENPNARKPD